MIKNTNSSGATFELQMDETWAIEEKKILSQDKNMSDRKILKQTLTGWNEIYFSGLPTTYQQKAHTTYLQVPQGIYIYDIEDTYNEYILQGNGFELSPLGMGLFVIDTRNNENITIFSINSIMNLSFIHNSTEKKLTSTSLFPHTYISFNPSKNTHLNKWDLLKISQWTNFGMFSMSLLQQKEVNGSFQNFFWEIPTTNPFFETTFQYIIQKKANNSKQVQDYFNTNLIHTFNEKIIQKYESFLYNENKRAIYLKNNILRGYQSIYKNIDSHTEIGKSLLEQLQELKNINSHDYAVVISLLQQYSQMLISDYRTNNDIKIIYYNLLQQIYAIKSSKSIKHNLVLTKAYYAYDFLNNEMLLRDLWDFILLFYQEELYKEYPDAFLFFIKKVLTSNFSYQKTQISSLTEILQSYNIISSQVYKSEEKAAIKTALFNNSDILNKILPFIKEKFFQEQKTAENLLVLKNTPIDEKTLQKLKENIKFFLDFYNKNEYILSIDSQRKNEKLKQIYNIQKRVIEEYLLAIEDYNSYILTYDSNKQSLINENSLIEKSDEKQEKLSIINIQNYLRGFHGVDISSSQIKIHNFEYCSGIDSGTSNENSEMPEYCYEVTGMFVLWIPINFRILPDGHILNNIFINGEQIPWEYSLDSIEKQLEEKSLGNSQGNTNKYNFQYFFINTFINKEVSSNNSFQYSINNDWTEDPAITIFKKFKLLWERWDFLILKDFIDITYNQIFVTKVDENYISQIQDASFNYKNSNDIFIWSIDALYDFEKHSFFNIVITPIDSTKRYNTVSNYTITVKEYIDIKEMYNLFWNIQKQLNKIFAIIEQLNSSMNIYNIEVIYNQKDKHITYHFINNENIIEIKTYNSIILSVSQNGITETKYQNKNFTELPIILSNLK